LQCLKIEQNKTIGLSPLDSKGDTKCEQNNRICARIDAFCKDEKITICLENDEREHKDYATLCEISRMQKVTQALKLQGHRTIVWIRFNPDAFQWNAQTVRVNKKLRFALLTQLLDHLAGNHNSIFPEIQEDSVNILYLFYSNRQRQVAAWHQLTDEGETLVNKHRDWFRLVKLWNPIDKKFETIVD
jgi:hypothetical protein